MHKRYLHHLRAKLKLLKPWYFVVLALLSGSVCIFALRQNNQHMGSLRNAVYAADKNGSGVQQALQNLQVFVTSHMNTELSTGPNAPYPPIQLEYTYNRAVLSSGAAASATNAQIYTDAQKYCEATIPNGFSGRYRISCVQDYIQSHHVNLSSVPVSLYEFDFVSPLWSPDLAGWSLLLAIVSLLEAGGIWLLLYVLKLQTRRS